MDVSPYALIHHRARALPPRSLATPAYDGVGSGAGQYGRRTTNAVYRATLEAWLEKEKPYCNPDFQLQDLRQVLPLNRTYLSRFVNTEYGCSFYQWVNRMRIEEAKRLKSEHPEWTSQEISQRCGFSSRRVFSQVFIRETGITPREWFAAPNSPK